MTDKVVIVHLRRPRLNDPNDSRRDPFWEFGSFGLTGCHNRNLMHPKRANELNGTRLAFVQGGDGVMKLVYLSPPVKAVIHKNVVEVRWEPSMPFSFGAAPIVVNNSGETLFPKLKQTFSKVERDTWARKFSSMYRTRRIYLSDAVAREVIRVFDSYYENFRLAITYDQALPFLPPKIDRNRENTHSKLLSKAKF